MSELIESIKGSQKEIKGLQTEQATQAGSEAQILKQLLDNFQVETLEEAVIVLEEFEQEKKKNDELLKENDIELKEIIASATKTTSATGTTERGSSFGACSGRHG